MPGDGEVNLRTVNISDELFELRAKIIVERVVTTLVLQPSFVDEYQTFPKIYFVLAVDAVLIENINCSLRSCIKNQYKHYMNVKN